MYGYIVYEKAAAIKNSTYIQWYIDKFKKKGAELELIYTEDIEKAGKADFAIVRAIAPDITKYLEGSGIRCFNNYFVSHITNDKALTYKYVSENGIEIMDVYDTDDIPAFPVVIKPRRSHGGDRVFMVHSLSELKEKLPLYENNDIVIQKAASDIGRDVRVYMIGKDIICAMLRRSDSDIRSNFCLGGKASVYALSKSETALVRRIADLFDSDFIGIDFVFNKGKAVFNEIEDVVGSRMVYSCTNIDIVQLYVEYIYKEMTT